MQAVSAGAQPFDLLGFGEDGATGVLGADTGPAMPFDVPSGSAACATKSVAVGGSSRCGGTAG